ncbi:flagellar basal body rod protein FlgB [Telmatobacter bradus]|uniref:flagellar basal body rod protein FlgB n=1 Tax=Telmatobacter bradus TaxID=474953 RepID=UPI003B4279EA
MNIGVETRMGEQLARYMDLANDQVKLTAVNMANVDTPGYRTLGMDFEAEMRTALGEAAEGKPAHHVAVQQVDGLIARPDGNNVSMDHESLNMAEAQLRFKTGVAMLRAEHQRILDAIHAADK